MMMRFRFTPDFPTFINHYYIVSYLNDPVYQLNKAHNSMKRFFSASQLVRLRQEEQDKARQKEASLEQRKKEEPARKVFTSGVGKFINPGLKKEARKAESSEPAEGPSASKKKKKSVNAFSDFSGW